MRGVVISGINLAHWRSLCWHWLSVIENYCQTMNYQGCPFYYYEKCNVHIFASAANQCGYISLVETPIQRSNSVGALLGGYLDLYISKDNTSEIIEAKYTSPETGIINDGFWYDLKYQLEMACNDASNIAEIPCPLAKRKNVKEERIGIVFVVPRFPANTPNIQIMNAIQTITTNLGNISFDVAAWYFSQDIQTLQYWYHTPNYSKISPGVLLLAKEV